jgi:hypothetical protein
MVQRDHDQKIYDLRERLVKTEAISEQLWVDTQNARDNSRIEFLITKDRLSVMFELGKEEIDAIKDEPGDHKARFTLRSRVDGTVIQVDAWPQDLADPKTVLMEIATAKP